MGLKDYRSVIRAWPLLFLVALACHAPDDKDQPFRPVEGAVLSVTGQSADSAARLMDDVQRMLLKEPALASQMLSHGAEPPSGYFFKFKGRCGAEPPAARRVREMLASAGATPVRCEDVEG